MTRCLAWTLPTRLLALTTLLTLTALPARAADPDQEFAQIAADYVDAYPGFGPVAATALGDHRFDSQLDQVSEESRAAKLEFYRSFQQRLEGLSPGQLSKANQIDYELLKHDLAGAVWRIETLQEWAWNPLVYTGLTGSAVYSLMAREFAPLPKRLGHVADRLEQFPRLFRQIRETLEPARVPKIHAETAVKQNRGVLSILDNLVEPNLDSLSDTQRQRLQDAMATARQAVDQHQQWLESELLPRAAGDFRMGRERFDQKLSYTFKTPLTRQEIRERAERELVRVRSEMYRIGMDVYRQKFPYTQFPETPSPAYQQAIIRAALELAYLDAPEPDAIVQTARDTLADATAFVRQKDLLTLPPDPVEIIIMPEFQRGVSLAYCDSPGPLDVGLKTFYAVAPLPEDWTEAQVSSFLREYNVRSIHDLTMHEAMPGHFVQLAHANRYPGQLRALLASGAFIEGWAIYSERMMLDEGYLDHDPLMRLINLKWYLRGIGNAMIDQAIHVDGMTREEAMRLMMEDTFQEEREAAAKWIRAQLTTTQLSTYFIGAQEHFDLRREIEAAWGDDFDLKRYHDQVMSYGSPPVQFVRAVMLDEPIPVVRPSR